MHIERVEIENYKGFLERQVLQFEPGFNLLVGANNSGKTTVLDVLDIPPNLNEPHRSVRTIPVYGGASVGNSKYEATLAMQFEELRQMVGWNQVMLPIREPRFGETAESLGMKAREFAAANGQTQWRVSFEAGAAVSSVLGGDLISGTADPRQSGALNAVLFSYTQPDGEPSIQTAGFGGAGSTIASYFNSFRSRIYRFNARRQPGTEFGNSPNTVLDREAASLPYFINHLQTTDAHGHRLLCEWISRIFPSVKWVQSPPNNGGLFQLKCLPQKPEERRDDLATPLARMGTGIGNIIAILYVVLTSRQPQVIAIDEPNAFLHPRAVRELLAILEAEGKQHQFILTAHSSDVLTAVRARTISLLEFDGVVTTVKQVGPQSLHALRGGLADLGIRVTDLHGKDRVLWVEGTTEELVMPALLRFACPEIAAGTAVLRVERTGTFSRKGVEPQEVARLYERLSTSSAFVPPMTCILLDGERKTTEERREMETSSQGRLRFLDRRMLENYLLDAEAIAAVLLELGETTTLGVVEQSLAASWANVPSADLSSIDGASVLASVFSDVSETRHEFRKTRDVPTLIEYLIEHYPVRLGPLRNCLRRACDLAA